MAWTKQALIGVFVAFVAIASSYVVTAQTRPLILGTEDQPELWGDDQVHYGPGFVGAQDHDYLAINRSWFDLDPTGQQLTLHLRVLSVDNLRGNAATWLPECEASANFTINATTTGKALYFSFSYQKAAVGGREVESSQVSATEASSSMQPTSGGQPMKEKFLIVNGTPGYYQWTIQRFDAQRFGTDLVGLRTDCVENQNPTLLVANEDHAVSRSDYSLEQARRVAAPDGQPDNLSVLSSRLPRITPSTSEEISKHTPGFTPLVLVVSTLLVLGSRRR